MDVRKRLAETLRAVEEEGGDNDAKPCQKE